MKTILGFLKRVAMFPLNVFLGVTTTDATGGAKAYTAPIAGFNKRFQVRSALITLPAGAATNDIIEAVPVKAGWLIHGSRVKIVTAAVGTAAALDIGITGGTVDGFDANIDSKAAAGTVYKSTPSDTYAAAGGHYVTAADTVDVKCKTITDMTTPSAFYVILDVEDLG